MLVYSIMIMEKRNSKLLNTILAFGMLAIFIGYLLILAFAGSFVSIAISILPAVLFLAGLGFLYSFMVFTRTPFKLFVGLCLTLYGMFSMLLVSSIFPYSIKTLWPLYLVFTAVALALAGRATGRKFTFSYDLLAIIFFIIGIIFLLFSLKIIQISFKSFMLVLGPFLILSGGVILVILVLYRKQILEALPKDLSSEFSDEEEQDL